MIILVNDRSVIIPEKDVRVTPVGHRPVEIVVPKTGVVHDGQFGADWRFDVKENETLMRLAVQRHVFQRVDAEEDDFTLTEERHVGREEAGSDGTVERDERIVGQLGSHCVPQ
jgi:hypothetical protein